MSRINPIRQYMFVLEADRDLGMFLVRRLTELPEDAHQRQKETKALELVARTHPNYFDRPMMVSGEDLELTVDDLEKEINGMSNRQLKKWVRNAFRY